MGASITIVQPLVEVVIAGDSPTVASSVNADTINGVTPGATGLLLLAAASPTAAAAVLPVLLSASTTLAAGALQYGAGTNALATLAAGTGLLRMNGAGAPTITQTPSVTSLAASGAITSATNVIGTDPGGSEPLRVGGSIRASGGNSIFGSTSAITLNYIDGNSSGTGGGSTTIYRAGGVPTIGMGNRSALLNLAYDATPMIYGASTIFCNVGMVFNSDPGGVETVRVGGTMRVSGKITTVSAVPGSFANLAAVQTWLAAQFT